MNDMNERERERERDNEWGDREKGQKVGKNTEEGACSENAITFNIYNQFAPKFFN